MQERSYNSKNVDEFILAEIDTVPHLEALLQFWTSRPRQWNADDMSGLLYVKRDEAQSVLESLARRGFIDEVPEQRDCFVYRDTSAVRNDLMADLEIAYKHDLIRITRMIHSKGPASVREFARAFRFKNDRRSN